MGTELAEIPILAKSALEHDSVLDIVLTHFQGKSRKNRQHAAAVFAYMAELNAERLVPIIPTLVEALDRPEAQTRWCVLEALTLLLPFAPEQCLEAYDGAEDALFDDKDGFLREKAFLFLCAVGGLSLEYSDKVWVLLDEAIQCYHGNPEYTAMLNGLAQYVESGISPATREGLIERLTFDAKNSGGSIGKRSQQILDTL